MHSPKVSVIIPNYNHGKYLSKRIETVLSQTYKNIEIIILDDFSDDESLSVIEHYRANPLVIKILLNKANSGSPFSQWRQGLQYAAGEWVWIAESDDYASEKFLERLINAAQQYENVGLVYCDSHVVNDDDSELGETFAKLKNERFNTDRWNGDHYCRGLSEIEDYLLPGGTINNTSAVLFNRKILMEANPFDISFRYIGDKYSFVKVLATSNCVYVKDAMNYFRTPFNSKIVDKATFYFYEQFLVFDWAYRNLPDINKNKFFEGFYINTRNSLFRSWDTDKVMVYRKLFKLNRNLFFRNFRYNLSEGIKALFKLPQ